MIEKQNLLHKQSKFEAAFSPLIPFKVALYVSMVASRRKGDRQLITSYKTTPSEK